MPEALYFVCKNLYFRMQIFFVLLLLIQTAAPLQAQLTRLDSLKIICRSAVKKQMKDYVEAMRYIDAMPRDSARQILKEAAAVLNENKTDENACRYSLFKAKYLYLWEGLDSSRAELESALKKYAGGAGAEKQKIELEYELSRLLMREAKYKYAIANYLELAAKAENLGMTGMMVRCNNSVGLAYMLLGQYDDAIKWFYKAVSVSLPYNEQYYGGAINNNLGSCYNNVGKYDSALLFVNKGLGIARYFERWNDVCNGLNIKADIFIKLKQNNKAEPLLLEAIEARKKIGNADNTASDMAQLAQYYATAGNYDKGIALAEAALDTLRKYNITSKLMFAYEALESNLKAKGDYKNANEVMRKMLILKDSLYSSNSESALSEIQAKYDVQKKEALITKQKLELLQNNLIFFGLALLVVLLGIGVYVAYRRLKAKQQNRIQSILEQEKIQRTQQVKEAESKERKRIAADLHDNLGVQANAIMHNAGMLKLEQADKNKIGENLQQMAKEMLVNLRETLWAMKSDNITAGEIWIRLINFCQMMGRQYKAIHISATGESPEITIASPRALNIVMIIQEAVSNAIQHASPSCIKTESSKENNNWKITVTDDGAGFNYCEAKKKEGHYGLIHLEERAATAGVLLTIQSAPGNGTTVMLIIPAA
jgi:signal transduction histidine kinase